jgi:hypothetical protein
VKLYLTIRKNRLKTSENSELRKISGPKGEEGTGGWRKLHERGFIISILYQI